VDVYDHRSTDLIHIFRLNHCFMRTIYLEITIQNLYVGLTSIFSYRS